MRTCSNLFLLMVLLLGVLPAFAQSPGENSIPIQKNTSSTNCVSEHSYYDGLGRLVEKVSVNLSPESGVDLLESISYDAFGHILQKGKPIALSGNISFANGEAVYHYYLKDHLGSNRVVVNQATGEVEQVNHYYPFGGLMAESTGGNGQRYKYNGKELDRMHGLDWYDYGARWYDGMRFLTQDPHATDYVDISPYAYCVNNPINAIDPDGKDSYYTTSGGYVCDNLKETDNIYIVADYKYLRQLNNGNWLVEFSEKKPITDAEISAKAYSEIFTDILKRKGFDTSLLENERVSVKILDANSANSGPSYELKDSFNASNEIPWSDAPIANEVKAANNRIQITANIVLFDSERRNYLSTISNVESILGVHEFLGHGVYNYNASEHWKILDMQMKHPTWKHITKELKTLYEILKIKNPSEYLQH